MQKILQSMANNKHTSIAAVVAFLTQAIGILWPELKPKMDEILKLAVIYGFALAGDGRPNSQDKPADDKRQSKLPFPLVIGALILLGAGMFSGCAASRQVATTRTTSTNPTNGVVTVTQTTARSSVVAAGDAKNVIDKIRASAGKTSSVGITGTDEATAASNLTINIGVAVELIRALKSP